MNRLDRTAFVGLLRARAAPGRRAPFDDGARIALAVEGGAMRGVISAGMVSALERLGLAGVFDAVYGSSAGAVNAAYFLAGQAALGTSIYYEDINGPRFINLRRALVGRPIVDLGFLLDDIAQRRKPLDTARVFASASPLAVLATDVEAREPRVFRGFSDPRGLFVALRAGATMPIVAGPPCEHEGRRYLDASLSEPIPVAAAERDGHTHVLVLMTRSGEMHAQPSAFDRYFVGPRLKRLSPDLASRYMGRAGPYGEVIRAINAGTGPLNRAQVFGIRVRDLHISKLECRRDVLKRGAELGGRAVDEFFRP